MFWHDRNVAATAPPAWLADPPVAA